MGAFGGLVLTNDGRNLQLKAQAGAQLNFTRMALGDGNLNGASMADLRNLINQKMSLNITKLKKETNRAVVGAVLSNQSLVTGFYFREIGIFATDPDIGEVLYCYGNAGGNGEYIPAGGGSDIIEKTIDVSTIVGNASTVTATIDQSLVYATKSEFDNHANDMVLHVTQTEKNTWNGKANQGDLDTLEQNFVTHSADDMPHEFTDSTDGKTYRYGFKTNVNKDGLVFVYEEVL